MILGNVNTNNLRNTINQAITGNSNLMFQSLLGNDITTTTTVTAIQNNSGKPLFCKNVIIIYG